MYSAYKHFDKKYDKAKGENRMDLLSVTMGGLSIHHVLLAFAGGIFGASIGAMASFIFCGVLILVGVAATFAGNADILNNVAFGCVFGPHVSFAAAVAAAAYAAKKKNNFSKGGGHLAEVAAADAVEAGESIEYLESGRDVGSAPMGLNRPDVLLVGGIFGVFGVICCYVMQTLLPFAWNGLHWTDSPGITVVISAIIARIMFGKSSIITKVPAGESRFKPVSDAWLPWASNFKQLFMIGLGAGLMSAYMTLIIGPDHGGVVLGFGISAVSLIFALYGTKIAVTHHITLIASGAAIASGSLVWGALFGIAAALVGQFMACTFLIHGDTHIDPPACTIFSMWIVIVLFGVSGIFGMIPLP